MCFVFTVASSAVPVVVLLLSFDDGGGGGTALMGVPESLIMYDLGDILVGWQS